MKPPAYTSAVRLPWMLSILVCFAALGTVLAMIDLKGISTDEGIRLGIINGGRSFVQTSPEPWPGYGDVLDTLRPYAYQPAYYLLQNTLMRIAGRQDLFIFRLANVAFLAVCLIGLLVLSRDWTTAPRIFLLGHFAFNAYLIMHVLQIREYIAAVAFYIWSTWTVLQLDRRVFQREWPDIGWFLGYGLLLTLGFYLQTWTVFPAIGQGIFLVLRRRPLAGRFLAHLGLSYMIAFTLTWPYLRVNNQKLNVGLWAPEKVSLFERLRDGFQLLLSGHLPNHHWFTSLLSGAWLALIAAAAWLLWRKRSCLRPEFVAETARQGWLMLACMAVPLSFQIAYFYKVEPLSVWPRYFVVHYFFLVWLTALAFRTLSGLRRVNGLARPVTVILAAASLLLACSAVYQVRSYWQDPYFDTSTSATSNWRTISRALNELLLPDDVVFAHDFISRSTLSASLPLARPVQVLPNLEQTDLDKATRLVYLESIDVASQRPALVQRMAALGYSHLDVHPIPATDGSILMVQWHILAFSRR